MADAKLFSPIRFGALELANRIVIAPMCQYSAEDGCMTDWHVIHLGQLALSGAALLTIEATAVVPEGRITYGDVGLYSDECERALGRVLESVRRWSDMPSQFSYRTPGERPPPRSRGKAAGRSCPINREDGRRLRRRRFPSKLTRTPPWRSIGKDLRASETGSSKRPGARRGWASALFSFTGLMVISCTNSSRPCRTGAMTNMAARLRTGCASRSRCSVRCAPHSRVSIP